MVEVMRSTIKLSAFSSTPLFLIFYLPSLLVSITWGLRTPILPLFASEISGGYGLVGLGVAGDDLGMLLTDLPAGAVIHV